MPLATAANIARDLQGAVIKRRINQETTMPMTYRETDTKAEAIANADAHTNNVGLPTYSELVNALRATVPHAEHYAAALLARIPA